MVVGFCFQREKKGEGEAGFYFLCHCIVFLVFFSYSKFNLIFLLNFFCQNHQTKKSLWQLVDRQLEVKIHLSHGGKGLALPMINATFFYSQIRGRFSLLSPFSPFPSLPLLSLSFPSLQNSQTKPKVKKVFINYVQLYIIYITHSPFLTSNHPVFIIFSLRYTRQHFLFSFTFFFIFLFFSTVVRLTFNKILFIFYSKKKIHVKH